MKTLLTVRMSGPLGSPLNAKQGTFSFYANTKADTFEGLRSVVLKELPRRPGFEGCEVFSVAKGSATTLTRKI